MPPLPFADASPGVTSLELLLPLTLSWAKKKNLTIQEILPLISSKPAEILGISKSIIECNKQANFCIFDPNYNWLVNEENLYSQGKNTPFLGYEMSGKVKATILDGQCVFLISN